MRQIEYFDRVDIGTLRVDARRPYALDEGYAELETAVDEAATEAYDIWEQATDMPQELIRQQPGSCLEMSFVLQERLALRGVASRLMEYREGPGAHYFLNTSPYTGELAADPTWQQMLLDNHPNPNILPDVLLVPTAQLPQGLVAHGVSPGWHKIWTQAIRSGQRWQHSPSMPLQRIFSDGTVRRSR